MTQLKQPPHGHGAPNVTLRTVVAALAVMLLSNAGCGSAPSAGSPEESHRSIIDLADPSRPVPRERFLRASEAYIIPGDEIEVRAYDNSDLSGLFMVPSDGKINFPFIGQVDVVGKTATQVGTEMSAALSAYFKGVDLTVNVKDPAQRAVYVIGQVQVPGRYEFSFGDRVLQALGRAGGVSDRARETGIVLVRRDPDGDHAYRLDFSRIHDFAAPADIHLQPGDVIFVPKGRFHTFTDISDSFFNALNRSLTSAVLADDVFAPRGNISISPGR